MIRAYAAAAAALACLAPTIAQAGPLVGVAFGTSEAKADAESGGDGTSTVGLFLRGRLSRALAVQAEVSKLHTDQYSGNSVRAYNVAALYDFGHGNLVPFALVGLGFDVLSYDGSSANADTFTHAELGLGLEYRFHGGFVLGADVRMGTRSNTDPPVYYDAAGGGTGGAKCNCTVPLYTPSTLSDGEYRSARLTLGVKF